MRDVAACDPKLAGGSRAAQIRRHRGPSGGPAILGLREVHLLNGDAPVAEGTGLSDGRIFFTVLKAKRD